MKICDLVNRISITPKIQTEHINMFDFRLEKKRDSLRPLCTDHNRDAPLSSP
jgi:hypothetical protein